MKSGPWERQPPPAGMRPSFFTSMWIRSPGASRSYRTWVRRDARNAIPVTVVAWQPGGRDDDDVATYLGAGDDRVVLAVGSEHRVRHGDGGVSRERVHPRVLRRQLRGRAVGVR